MLKLTSFKERINLSPPQGRYNQSKFQCYNINGFIKIFNSEDLEVMICKNVSFLEVSKINLLICLSSIYWAARGFRHCSCLLSRTRSISEKQKEV